MLTHNLCNNMFKIQPVPHVDTSPIQLLQPVTIPLPIFKSSNQLSQSPSQSATIHLLCATYYIYINMYVYLPPSAPLILSLLPTLAQGAP